ncbi:hypothetical protein [Oceanobacillus kimchii]|uniref:Uncharacterized protein n=1 Tax=Oceanobacillus kimchii TaxID=746691 RepID=A0ABQ5TKD6_9BACI|nr:hypothetical protein [Oceanobacillus kimchii]GLO66149.1 hypothetical protein MACH08_19330 [Oceanobacillus kimchii]
MTQIGGKFIGSPSLLLSEENQQVVPEKTVFYKFSFLNDEDVHVKINNSHPIFIRAGQGFSMNEVDAYINSFVIVDAGISFNWIGGTK